MKTEQIVEQAHETFTKAQEGVAHIAEQVKPLAQEAVKKSQELYSDARGENAEGFGKLRGRCDRRLSGSARGLPIR